MPHHGNNNKAPRQSEPDQDEADDGLQSSEEVASIRAQTDETLDESMPRSMLRNLSLTAASGHGQGGERSHHHTENALGVALLDPDLASVYHSIPPTDLFACPFLQYDRAGYLNWEGCQQPHYSISSIKNATSNHLR